MHNFMELIKESDKHISSKSLLRFLCTVYYMSKTFFRCVQANVSLNLWDGKHLTFDKPHKLKAGHTLIQYVHFYYIFVLPVL